MQPIYNHKNWSQYGNTNPSYGQYANNEIYPVNGLTLGVTLGRNMLNKNAVESFGEKPRLSDLNKEFYIKKDWSPRFNTMVRRNYEGGGSDSSTTYMQGVKTPFGDYNVGTREYNGTYRPAYSVNYVGSNFGLYADGYRDMDNHWNHTFKLGTPVGHDGEAWVESNIGPSDKRFMLNYQYHFPQPKDDEGEADRDVAMGWW